VSRRDILFTVFAAVVLLPGAGSAADYISFREDESLQRRCLAGIHATLNDRFAEAESLFTALTEEYPTSPLGPLFVAGAIHAHMIDCESPARYDEYVDWLRQAEDRGDALSRSGDAPAEAAFALGVASGYEAVYESRWGGWFAALKKGLKAKNRFSDALKHDSTLVDALVGIGNYNFWKAAHTDFINWLPLVPDRRAEGIAQLERVIAEGVLAGEAARSSLVWALIQDERYEEALAHADTLAGSFPESKVPLWMTACASFKLYRWDDAHDLYDEIERRITINGPGNYYNLVECAYYRAQCDYEAGRWRDAAAECHQVSGYPLPDETRERQKKKLADLRRLRRELAEMLVEAPEAEGGS